MRSKLIPIENFLARHVALLLRLAGVVSVTSGLIGGYVWLLGLADRSDGDELRWGFFHNPFMQFPPFNEPFLDASMWVLLACSAAAGLGGLILLAPHKWGVPLVTWQARLAIVTNGATAFIIAMMFVFANDLASLFANDEWDEWHLGGASETLALRLGSIAVDLLLWTFLSSKVVSEFWARQSHPAERGFDVIIKGPVDQAEGREGKTTAGAERG